MRLRGRSGATRSGEALVEAAVVTPRPAEPAAPLGFAAMAALVRPPRQAETDQIGPDASQPAHIGRDRLVFHPNCGFATFADNPICSAGIAVAKLQVIAQAVAAL